MHAGGFADIMGVSKDHQQTFGGKYHGQKDESPHGVEQL